MTEIIQKVEEHTRREEVERTRLRREKKEKKQRSGYHHGGSHEMVSGYDSAGIVSCSLRNFLNMNFEYSNKHSICYTATWLCLTIFKFVLVLAHAYLYS